VTSADQPDGPAPRTSGSAAPVRRWNPLSRQWVLVSPGRSRRPWRGEVGGEPPGARPHFDPSCHLCPGNIRASGTANPAYEGPWLFENDFPALLPANASPGGPVGTGVGADGDGLFVEEATSGQCWVMCYSPDHSANLGTMTDPQLGEVVEVWAQMEADLLVEHSWVQIFENRGTQMGASSPHPHCQVWATRHIPSKAVAELVAQRDYFDETGRALLVSYAEGEALLRSRVVVEHDEWLAVVPWWAEWPFELLLLPRFAVQDLAGIHPGGRSSLAATLRSIVRTYDRLFGAEFPYSFGWHSAPAGGAPGWQLHGHFYPPLLRSATVRKHMVGFELLSESQRDLTPEDAAARLRGEDGS
jgi:UDPglucose--hexose-1-phosphate uridylyltransferase